MRPRLQALLLLLTLSLTLAGCGGGSTPTVTPINDTPVATALPLGSFLFARASGTSAQAASARRASRVMGPTPRISASQTPAASAYRIYRMDHHGAQGSELLIGATADYESVHLSADRTKFVYCAYASNGYYQIYTAKIDGTDVKQLTTDLEDHWEAQFSPDGSQIVYVRGMGGLGLMSSAGTTEQLVNTDRFYIDNPIILSTGKLIFEGFDSEIDQLFAVNQDGTGLISFTNGMSNPFYYFENVAVSADNRKILFSAYDTATDTENVFIADFNTAGFTGPGDIVSNVVKLTTSSTVVDHSFDPMFVDDRIVFVSSGDTEPVGSGEHMEIYSMKYDGSDLQRLTRNTDYEWFIVPYYYYAN